MEMQPDQIRAMYAQQNNPQAPKLHSSVFNQSKSEPMNDHKRKHLQGFAKIVKKGLFHSGKAYGYANFGANIAKKKNQERTGQKEANYKELNNRITNIVNTDEPPTQKIQSLQTLLNQNHKKMTPEMMQRVRHELSELHGSQPQTNNAESYENDPFHPLGKPSKDEVALNRLAVKHQHYADTGDYPVGFEESQPEPEQEHKPEKPLSGEALIANASILSQVRNK